MAFDSRETLKEGAAAVARKAVAKEPGQAKPDEHREAAAAEQPARAGGDETAEVAS